MPATIATLPWLKIPPLSHWRHTARVLFNQLTLGEESIELSANQAASETPTLFVLRRSSANQPQRVVQFPAVVEHQLAVLKVDRPTSVGLAPSVSEVVRDIRWTVVQDVRWGILRN